MQVLKIKNNEIYTAQIVSGAKNKYLIEVKSNKQANHSERQEQRWFTKWLDLQKIDYFAIPNGGSRHKLEAYNLKLDGVKSGVPDIFIPIANRYHHGLFIEMKKQNGGKVSRTQQEWIDRLIERGYLAVVCNGWDEAREITEKYLMTAK